MKCLCKLDYNIRMSAYSLNKYSTIVALIFAISLLSGCGNKGPLNLPNNTIKMTN